MEIPKEVKIALKKLIDSGYEAYIVGGCVRDFLLGRESSDWDIATSATPYEIQKVFKKTLYENKFGTVTVFIDGFKIEVTTYRSEEGYSDKRHPDSVKYLKSLEEDLKRRDFTINAMAYSYDGVLIDLFSGEEDLKNRLIRAVGDPEKRFSEDALRILRAIRFAAQLDFQIEKKTALAIKKLVKSLKDISNERIRDELVKIIMSKKPKYGFDLMKDLGVLEIILPEVAKGIGVSQNKHHIYDVYEHNTRALQYTADQNYPLHVRIAALLHDVAKPQTKRGEGENATFYNHEVLGAKMAKNILKRLKFPNEIVNKVYLLVRYHLFYYNVGEVTESSVRRLIAKVGLENIEDLLKVRYADRIGSGTPKAEPYKLRHFRYMVHKVSKDPISVKMLAINGNDLIKELNLKPSPILGLILNALLSEVLDDPSKNKREILLKRAKEMLKMSASELSEIIKKGEEKIKFLEEKEKRMFRV